MGRSVSEALRILVIKRAGQACEYCLIPVDSRFLAFHIEHIISLKHGGKTVETNLALSCPHCNYNKGSDLGMFLDDDKELVRFFNPRKDIWSEHFESSDGVIYPLTAIGTATCKILQFNTPERIIFRKELL